MLNKIVETKRQELQQLTLPEENNVERFSLYKALRSPNRPVGLIAEVKKASPSKGVINDAIDPVEIAREYEEARADAISVLTDETYFKGNRQFLIDIKKSVRIPVLRKDFIIDEKQIEESKRIGADAILLIVAVLGAEKTEEFYNKAEELGLECLVEVHSEQELSTLLERFTPRLIGVNNRDLATFQTSVENTGKLAKKIPPQCLFISESGIHSSRDMEKVKSFGANGVLVGESLMRAETPAKGIASLYGEVTVGY
ncbi:indole-3-glycerol phosphate synthase TrpC [Pseudalkalibacillus caeni]|uniref:Indole-3-glycerol phosphate synthase n=1 Tax=Exobacillus caeni TaxID=2574798 RepID=A0A5R9EZL8_9BACL|nr:indole-3-glycerol phosphate synthase TrpC [Pseudalkalibacillus caeni]TLS35909.1 indole-3-glycerol phosphate synthase TrpC [Pseudalkalibacillus caeni]